MSQVGAAVFEELTAEGTGHGAGSGVAVFARLTATGSGSAGTVGTGAPSFEELTASGHQPPNAAGSFERIAVQGTGLTGTVGRATPSLRAATAAATGYPNGRGNGAATFQALVAGGRGRTEVRGTAEVALRRAHAAGTGLTGTVGTGAAQFALLAASGRSHTAITGSGAASFELMTSGAFGGPTIAEEFRAWVMNTRNLDLTEFTNYDFNSFARFNDAFYAAGPNGVFRLDGSDDDGTPIAVKVRTGSIIDRDGFLARIPEVLLQAASTGPINVTVLDLEGHSFAYQAPYVGINALHQVRVLPGKGLRAVGYQVEITNNEGAPLELGVATINTVPVSRRIA